MSNTYGQCSKCQSLNKVDPDKAQKHAPVCGKCGSPLLVHGLVSEVNAENFHKILRLSAAPVVVDFWASWCGPCKTYAPEYEKASLQNTGSVFLKVDTEAEQGLSAELGIKGIPTTVLFRGGKEVRRQTGAMQSSQLHKFIG